MFKLIALDMDGTILNHQGQLSSLTIRRIQEAKEAGCLVVLATGRDRKDVLPYAEQMDLEGPFIVLNGGEIWEKRDTLLQRSLLRSEHVERMLTLAHTYQAWYWSYTTQGKWDRDLFPSSIKEHKWLKFCFHLENQAHKESILEELTTWGDVELSNSHPNNIEVNAKGVSKAAGLQIIAALTGVTLEEMIAVGDSLNDRKMIQAAGLGVAMGNAQEAVKQIADYITLRNDQDGVARVIEKFILQTSYES